MKININDEDLMNIEVFEEMEVNVIEEMGSKSSDEDHPLSDDSDCISDCSENFTKISKKIIDNSQIKCVKRTYETVRYIFLLFYGWCFGCVHHA